jgi:hypothetical protein
MLKVDPSTDRNAYASKDEADPRKTGRDGPKSLKKLLELRRRREPFAMSARPAEEAVDRKVRAGVSRNRGATGCRRRGAITRGMKGYCRK